MYFGENQIIEFILTGIESQDGDVLDIIEHSYATEFSPIYSTPNKVRAIAGSYIKRVPDEILWYLIHLYSVEANMVSTCSDNDPDKWKYYASLWVTYKTALNAIYNAEVYMGESGNKSYKKLGDFSISKDGSKNTSGPARGLIEKLECDIFKLEVSVRHCREPLLECTGVNADTYSPKAAQPTIKGGSRPRPAFGRTFYSGGRHPQWTGMIKGHDRWMLTNKRPNGFLQETRDYRTN